MKCYCGKEVLFLIDGQCQECRKNNIPNRKRGYVVRITKDWFYDGGDVSKNGRLPARRGRHNAKEFISKGPACKVALLYGGIVEEVK